MRQSIFGSIVWMLCSFILHTELSAQPLSSPSGNGGMYGLGAVKPAPKVYPDLSQKERAKPDQGYVFDLSSPYRRLDHQRFDPVRDSFPYNNTSLTSAYAAPANHGTQDVRLGPVCFGISLATIRWWQEKVAPHLFDPVTGVERPGDPGTHLAEALHTGSPAQDDAAMASFLRSVHRHQDQASIGLNGAVQKIASHLGRNSPFAAHWNYKAPGHQEIYRNFLMRDLKRPQLGATDLGFMFTCGMKHAVIAYSLTEGTAVNLNQGNSSDFETHSVRAIRVGILDSNLPMEADAASTRAHYEGDYVLYFPKSQQFGVPAAGRWRELYDSSLPKNDDNRKRMETLWKENPETDWYGVNRTFLGPKQVVVNEVNRDASNTLRLAAYEDHGIDSLRTFEETVRLQLERGPRTAHLESMRTQLVLASQKAGFAIPESASPSFVSPITDRMVTEEVDRRLVMAFKQNTAMAKQKKSVQ